MDNADVPRGRISSILLFALLTCGTIVLMIVPFLSQHSKYHISFLIVYVWEIILFVCALLAMVLIIILRKHNEHLMVTQDDISRKQHVTRCLIFALFGLSASILPFYECKQVSTCLDVEDRASHALQFATYLCIGIYTNFHSIFAILCYKYRCKSFVTRLLVVVILSANASLLGNCVLNTIRSLNTQPSRDPFIHHSWDKNTYEAVAKNSTEYYFGHTLVYSVCQNGTEIIDQSSTTQHVYKYTYSLLGQFVLMTLSLLVPLWNIINPKQTNPANINDMAASTILYQPIDYAQDEIQPLVESPASSDIDASQGRIVNTLKRTSRFVSQHSIAFSSVFAATVFVLRVCVEIRIELYDQSGTNFTTKNLTSYEIDYYYLQTFYIYIISIVPFIGYFIARQQQNTSMWRFDVDTALLILSGFGYILLVIFETVDSITVLNSHPSNLLTEDVVYFIKILFHYVGIYFQIKVIIKASCLHIGRGGLPDQKVHVKGIIIFLGICNAERWLASSFMPPTVLRYANDIQGDDTFGHVNWWIIVQVIFPTVTFYRMWSALMCFNAFDLLGHQ